MNKLFHKFKRKNQKGQGLVSVLIAGGVGAMILGFIGDMMIQQGIGQKFLTQKLEMNDLTNNVIATFSKSNACTCQFANNAVTNPNFANFANLNFNSTVIDGTQKISVKKLYSGCLGGPNAPLVLAEEGVKISNSGLTVDKVELVNLRPTGGPNEWQGQWQISFLVGGGSLTRSVRPISITQKITVNPGAPYSAVAAAVSACNGVSSGTGTNDFLAKWSLTQGLLQDSGIFEDSTTGNIGIGTQAPTDKFQITSGNLGVNGGFLIARLYNNIPTDWRGFAAAHARGTQAAPAASQANDKLGAFTTSGHDGTNWVGSFEIGGVQTGLSTATGAPGDLYFATLAGVPTERMRITKDGNLGLGTSTPAALLHIVNTAPANTKAAVLIEGDFGLGGDNSPDGHNMGVKMATTGIPFAVVGNAMWLLRANSDAAPYNGVSGSLSFERWIGTGATSPFLITSTGNVGIGTLTTPTKLTVNGGIKIGNEPAGCAASLEGTQRYNSGSKIMEFCNGTSWSSMGGSGSINWKNPTQTYTYSAFSNTDYGLGSTYSLCLLTGTGTNNGGCYLFAPSQSGNPSPGNWLLSLEAYGLNSNCYVSCWN